MHIFQVKTEKHKQQVYDLWWEYLHWANGQLNEHYNIDFDVQSAIENDMATIDKFMPPSGRLLVAEINGELVGCASMKKLTDDISEIKRMYVQPKARGQGIGRAFVDQLIADCKQSGYRTIRLDSSKFMHDAHQLYQAAGFQIIPEYDGSEIPPDYRHNWYFMELRLDE